MLRVEFRDGFLLCRASGVLTHQDYAAAVPELENALELAKAPVRLMISLENFHGWEIGALWDELRFGATHGRDFSRVAVVGERALEEWGTRLSKPFVKAEMRYFGHGERQAAEAWLLGSTPSA